MFKGHKIEIKLSFLDGRERENYELYCMKVQRNKILNQIEPSL